jgi:hypothetical protein
VQTVQDVLERGRGMWPSQLTCDLRILRWCFSACERARAGRREKSSKRPGSDVMMVEKDSMSKKMML